MSAAETHMDLDRITHPLRLAKVLVGAFGAVISVGLAAPAGASPVIRNPRPSRTSWPPYGRRASPERIRRCWKTATACAGDCGFGRCRVLR